MPSCTLPHIGHPAPGSRMLDRDEPVRFRKRKGSEDHRIHQSEDGGGGPDTQSQNQDHHSGK